MGIERLKFSKLQQEIKEIKKEKNRTGVNAAANKSTTHLNETADTQTNTSAHLTNDPDIIEILDENENSNASHSVGDPETDAGESRRSKRARHNSSSNSSPTPHPQQATESSSTNLAATPKTPRSIRPQQQNASTTSPPFYTLSNSNQQSQPQKSPVLSEQSNLTNSSAARLVSASSLANINPLSNLMANPMVVFSSTSPSQQRISPFGLPPGFNGTIFINPTIHVHMNRNEPDLSQFKEIKPKEAKPTK